MSNLDLDEILKRGEKVYVVNETDPRGVIFFILYGREQQQIKVNIPNTPHPFCLSDIASVYALKHGSQMLRTIISKGALRFMSQTDAEIKLRDPEVRRALAKSIKNIDIANEEITNYKRNKSRKDEPIKVYREGEGPDPDSTSDEEDMVKVLPAGNQRDNGPIKIKKENGNISQKVVIVVSQLSNDELTAKEAKQELMEYEDRLTLADLAYLNEKTTGQVRDYAINLVNKLKGNAPESGPTESDEPDPSEVEARARRAAEANEDPEEVDEGEDE